MATEMMTETGLETMLHNLLDTLSYTDAADLEDMGLDAAPLIDSTVETFEATGLMTNNRGLVLRLADGREFQLQIVQQGRGC
jgi:hypothetical protein